MSDEVYRTEPDNSYLKMEKRLIIPLADGTESFLEVFKLMQLLQIRNEDNVVTKVIHHEVHPELNMTAEQIQKKLDVQIAESQAEIDKHTEAKQALDAAPVFAVMADAKI